MAQKLKRITEFEETCMWMSYRYAIGRRTAAALTHAQDIAENFYYRIPNDRKEFTSFDIAREIYDKIHLNFNLHIDYPIDNNNFHPFEILMEFIKNENIKDLNEFNKFKSIRYNVSNGIFGISYDDSYVDAYHSSPDGSEQKEEYKKKKDYWPLELDILLSWQQLSAAFDVNNLKVITLELHDTTIERICFKSYVKNYGRKTEIDLQGKPYEINDLENQWWDEIWVPIEDYTDGSLSFYPNNEYIKGIRDLTDEERRKLERFN